MGVTFRLLFNLYPGEGKKAALFIVLGLLWSIGSYGTFTLSEGMFLEGVGAASLPYAYIAIAVGMCLLSSLLLFALNHLSVRHLLVILLSVWGSVTGLAAFSLPLWEQAKWGWLLYKVLGWTIPLSTYILYWAFIDQYFDLQDGKRFFSLFNGVTFLGDALGSAVLAFLLKKWGVQGTMLFFSGCLICALPCIPWITRKLTPLPEEHAEGNETPAAIPPRSLLRTILKSPYTLVLISVYFLTQLLTVTTEYTYMTAFEADLGRHTAHALTAFVGRCGMWISLGNMLFAMFLYSRLVKKWGVNNLLLIAPLFFSLLFIGWQLENGLFLAVCGMVAREGLVYTFDDNNLVLLLSAVPSKIKNQVRLTIESFVEPVAVLLGAFALLCWKDKNTTFGLLLAGCALIAACCLRSLYPKALFRNLVAQALRFEKKATDWIRQFTHTEKKQTEFLLLAQLKQADEQAQLLAYEYLLKMGNGKLLPRLLDHIGKLTLPGKLRAIELLGESQWAQEPLLLERLERWRRILPHPAIKSTIHFYFARYNLLRPERVMHDLHQEHLGLRAAAILTLKTAPYAHQLPTFCSLATEKLRQLLTSTDEPDICTGIKILGLEHTTENFPWILSFLEHPSLAVQQAAAEALSYAARPEMREYAEPLAHILGKAKDAQVRKGCLETLCAFADPLSAKALLLASRHCKSSEKKQIEKMVVNMGREMTPMLFSLIEDIHLLGSIRLLAAKILAKLDGRHFRHALHSWIRQEVEKAYFYAYHAQALPQLIQPCSRLSSSDLSILKNVLLSRYQTVFDLIVQMLAIGGELEESEILVHTLHSQNRRIRAQALESLEKAADARLFALIRPLVYPRSAEERAEGYVRSGGIPLSFNDLIDFLAHSSSPSERIVAEGILTALASSEHEEEPKNTMSLMEAFA